MILGFRLHVLIITTESISQNHNDVLNDFIELEFDISRRYNWLFLSNTTSVSIYYWLMIVTKHLYGVDSCQQMLYVVTSNTYLEWLIK